MTTPANAVSAVALDPTPPLLPRVPSWQTLLGLLLATLAITGLCAEGAFLVSLAQPKKWEARSQIEYRGEAWVETAAEELSSRSRISAVAEAEGIPIKKFEENLTAGAVPGTQILQYAYVDHDANLAYRVVQALTDSYLSAPENSLDDQIGRLEAKVGELESQLAVATAQLDAVATPPGEDPSAAERIAESDVNRIQTQLAEAENQLLEAELNAIKAEDQLPEVVTDTFVLNEPVSPRPLRRAAYGVLAGLVLSGIFAGLVLSRDPAG